MRQRRRAPRPRPWRRSTRVAHGGATPYRRAVQRSGLARTGRARSRCARRRCRAGASSDPSRGIGAAVRWMRGCERGGQGAPVRFPLDDSRQHVGHGVTVERRAGRSASRRARSRTPRCRSACRPPGRAPAPGSCRPPCRGSRPSRVAARSAWVTATRPRPRRHGAAAFASPKSSTFTTPSGRILMFAGFRSRWTMPCSCAASSASAICRAIVRASASGRPAGAPVVAVLRSVPRNRRRRIAAARRASRPRRLRAPARESRPRARGRGSSRCWDGSATPAVAPRARTARAARGRS